MKPIALDDFCRIRSVSDIAFSPSGKNACFVVTGPDKASNGYRSYLYTLRDGKPLKLTSFGKESRFVFLDDETLLFPGKRDESKEPTTESVWYRLSLTGGEAEPAVTFPIPVSRLLPLPGGDFLAVGTVFPGWEDLYRGDPKRRAAFLKEQKENADYEVIAQSPWWWNGTTFTKGAYDALFRWSAKKKALTRVTPENVSVTDVEAAFGRGEAYFLTRPVTPMLRLSGVDRLNRLNLATMQTEELLAGGNGFELCGALPGESFLLVLGHDGKYGLNTDTDFYRLDYATGKLSLLAKHGEAIGSSVGTDVRYGGGYSVRMDGDVCYFITTRFDGAFLYKLEGGEISPVITRPGSVDCFDARGGKLLLSALWDLRPQELYDGTGKRLTRLNDAALRGCSVARPEELNVSRGDYDVHGFVLKPADYDPAKKYPVIFDIHGGPKTVYGPVFYHEMQYWAGQGYFVIFANPTGSDGRGAFMDIRGKYGTVDYEDLMAFCDAALEKYPQMDRENVFETGGSYGGFMTNWIIGHTDRFRACASQRSISNWLSFWGVSDIGPEFTADQNLSTPWDNPEKLWEHSPLKYADRVKTPTLFIHSFEDYRCPIDQGYQMFTALLSRGVEAKMVCFRGENHDLSRTGKPLHRIRRIREITEWFKKHQ